MAIFERRLTHLVTDEERKRRAEMSVAAQRVNFTIRSGGYVDGTEWQEFRLVWTQLKTGVITQGEFDAWVAKMNNRPRSKA